MSDYKAAKEAFVADNPGSSVHYINAISLSALTAYAVYAAVSRRVQSPLVDYMTMVFPLLLGVTVFAEAPMILSAVLVAIAGVVGLERAQPVAKSTGQWLNESDSEDDAPILSRAPRPGLTVKLPSEVVAEVREKERVELERTRSEQSLSSALSSPTSLGPGQSSRRRLSPAPTSAHTIDIGASPPTSPPANKRPFNAKETDSRSSASPRRRNRPLIVDTSPRNHLPFLTVYRAHMMVMTVHCILAVDFSIFPRVLGKCENFGTGLMDVGVGSFVFSLGIVTSKAFAPAAASLAANSPLRTALSGLRKALPILALGFVRLLMVKGVEYPEHVTEYGVHWNFFFTLGLVPALASMLLPLRKAVRWHTLALGIAFVFQLILSYTSLQDFLLSPLRPGLLGENKEGLASLPGYLAIFLLGLSAGEHVLRATKVAPPRSPEEGQGPSLSASAQARANQKDKRRTELALELAAYAAACWAALGLANLLGIEVSRRFANFSYVLWVVAYNTSYLAGYLAVELWFFDVREPASPPCPPLLDAINANGLAVFLASNLLTGLVNVTVQTMYASTATAMVVLTLYSAGTCALAWAIRKLKIRI